MRTRDYFLKWKAVKEALRIIADKFDNDMYSLCAVIHFLGYPQNTVNDLRNFLSSKEDGELIGQKQTKFYQKQLSQLHNLTETEEHILEILGKNAVSNNLHVKVFLMKILQE